MAHVIIIYDRNGNIISEEPGQHRHAEEDHEPTKVVLDIEKIIDLYNINTNKGKSDGE